MIRLCLEYAECIAGQAACFRVDPDGDSKFAAPRSDVLHRNSVAALKQIIRHRATTAQGISAKARLVSVLIEGDVHDEDNNNAFYLSFARDVGAFLETGSLGGNAPMGAMAQSAVQS